MSYTEVLTYNEWEDNQELTCPRCRRTHPELEHATCTKCECNLIMARYGNALRVREGIEGIEWPWDNPIPVRVMLWE